MHLYRILITLSLCAALTAAADWPCFRGDAQRSGAHALPTGFPSSQTAQWTRSLSCAVVSSPALLDNMLYIGGRDSCIYALDAQTGTVRWKKKTDGWVDATPAANHSVVVAGSRDGFVYVLNAQTAHEVGRLRADLPLSSPVFSGDSALIIGSAASDFGLSGFALSPLFVPGAVQQADWNISLAQGSYSSPALSSSITVIGSNDGTLYGIDPARRQIVWRLSTGGGGYMASPAISNGVVYYAPGNDDRNLYAVSLQSGIVQWQAPCLAPAAAAKRLAQMPVSGRLVAELARLSPEHRLQMTQRLQAQGVQMPFQSDAFGKAAKTRAVAADFIPYGDSKTSSVAIGDDNIYIIQKEPGTPAPLFSLYAFDKSSGAMVWNYAELRSCVPVGYCSSPLVAGGAVYAGWGEGMLYSFDAHSGRVLWRDTLDGDIISSPAIANGALYVATIRGTVYSYALTATAPAIDFSQSTYCYPNPARKTVSNIQVYVARSATLTLSILSMNEKPVTYFVRALVAGEKYVYAWNIDNVANGVYLARVRVVYDDGKKDEKMLKIAVLK